MTRVQAFIVGLRIHDKKLREEEEKQRGAFGTNDANKIKTPKSLEYNITKQGDPVQDDLS